MQNEDDQEDNIGNNSMNGKHTLMAPHPTNTSHHKRLGQLSRKPTSDIPSQQATQHHLAGLSPIENSPTKPEATDDTSITKSKDDEANTHSSMSSTLSPTDDMSISTAPKHFTISAHTPDGNVSDSSHDSEKTHPLPKQYCTNPGSQAQSNKNTPCHWTKYLHGARWTNYVTLPCSWPSIPPFC